MKLLHITEPRCAGRDPKSNTICGARHGCLRHTQMDTDRKLGIDGFHSIRVMALPYVAGQDCHYQRESA